MSTPPRLRSLFDAAAKLIPGSSRPDAAAGLQHINSRLGLDPEVEPLETHVGHHTPRPPVISKSADRARDLYYAPNMDGQPEPGEVVWVWTPSDTPGGPLRSRAVLVVGHEPYSILGLLISPNKEHDSDPKWLEIGTGEWDESGRNCWVRLDRILEVPTPEIRRQGLYFPRRRFDRVAAKLRDHYGWG